METTALSIACDLVRPNDSVVDIGAGIYQGGVEYITPLLKRVGVSGKVYAIDPFNLPEYDFPNLIKINRPVWSKTSNIKSNILFPIGLKDISPTQIKDEYEAITIDDLFPTEDISFMKIDIEGAEAEALKGAKNLIYHNPELKIILECHWSLLPKFNTSGGELWEFINSLGLKISPIRINNSFPALGKQDFFDLAGSHFLLMKEEANKVYDIRVENDKVRFY